MANNQGNTTNAAGSQQENNASTTDGVETARRLDKSNGVTTIEVSAPWRQGYAAIGGVRVFSPDVSNDGRPFPGGGVTHDVHNSAVIKIEVRELQGAELGALRNTGAKLEEYKERAIDRKSAEDKASYGFTTAELKDKAIQSGYYNSPSHEAWAEAASARTGGKLSAEWMKNFDPTGGTNGNGPNLLAGGAYPHPLSRIGMAHDTDWSLGRHFQAGPMRGLYGANYDAETLGKYGLDPTSPINPPARMQYATGNSDWSVQYNNHPTQTRRAGIDGNEAAVVASAKDSQTPDNHPLYKQALAGIEKLPGDAFKNDEHRQNAAGSLAVEANNNNFKQIGGVAQSTNGATLFATNGALNDPASEKVSLEKVQAVSQPVEKSAQLLQQDTQQVAQAVEQKKATQTM
jgi:hypothetical protein